MNIITRPLLAVKIHSTTDAPLPAYCTPKIDGFRCLKLEGKALSRSFKPIRNNYVREQIERHCPDGLDGELIIRGGNFNDVQSQLARAEGMPDFEYLVFDYISGDLHEPYISRTAKLMMLDLPDFCKHLLPMHIDTEQDLVEYESLVLEAGYEGVMLRNWDSIYKCGRSTLREGHLIALKRFEDSEAIICGFIPQYHNENPKELNELGLTKRSSHQENQIQLDTLGALQVVDSKTLVRFELGTGFTAEARQELWTNQAQYMGRIITYKYQAHGMKDKPRSPVFKGFRSAEDIS